MRDRRSWHRVGLLLGVLTVWVGASFVLPHTRKKWGDLQVYLLGSQWMMAGEPVYRPEPSTDESGAFTYPPFFALPTMPLTLLPTNVQRSAWYFVNLGMLGATLTLLIRLVPPLQPRRLPASGEAAILGSGVPPDKSPAPDRPFPWHALWLVLLTAGIGGRFLIAPIENQSHDLIVLFLLVLGVWLMQWPRRGLSGVSWGLAAACKATPLLLLPLLLWRRQWIAAGLMVVTLVGATLLPDLLFPAKASSLWVVQWYDVFVAKVGVGTAAAAAGAWREWAMLNQSLSATLYRLFTAVPASTPRDIAFDVSLVPLSRSSLRAVTLISEALVLGWLAWVSWPSARQTSSQRAGIAPGIARSDKTTADAATITESDPSKRGAWSWVGLTGVAGAAMVLLSPVSSKAHFGVLILGIVYTLVTLRGTGEPRPDNPPVAPAGQWGLGAIMRRGLRSPVLVTLVGVSLILGLFTGKDLLGKQLGDTLLAMGSPTWLAVCVLVMTGLALRANRKTP